MSMWSGRMDKKIGNSVHRLNASLPFDIRLLHEDIVGSLAWVQALTRVGVLSSQEERALRRGLDEVREIIADGTFEQVSTDEDIHTLVERLLTESIGPLAKKLHTGRSRNDQVATDFRLWVMRACDRLEQAIVDLASAILESAERWLEAPIPGYTHLQQAQPVTWGHWMLAHFWPLQRDRQRFSRAQEAASALP